MPGTRTASSSRSVSGSARVSERAKLSQVRSTTLCLLQDFVSVVDAAHHKIVPAAVAVMQLGHHPVSALHLTIVGRGFRDT